MPPKRNSNLRKKTTKPSNPKPKTKTGSIKKQVKKIFCVEQKSSIASRLLEISLKVDDYVYKNIPISAKNAALYLKEVSGYKDRCLRDKRSLQVIEKLERCMKGIIDEQQGQGCDGIVTYTPLTDNSNDTCNRTAINKDTSKATVSAVYNKQVDSDLSWIENLRYVREISTEEKIPIYYKDSF